jgi:hypothetical protein
VQISQAVLLGDEARMTRDASRRCLEFEAIWLKKQSDK